MLWSSWCVLYCFILTDQTGIVPACPMATIMKNSEQNHKLLRHRCRLRNWFDHEGNVFASIWDCQPTPLCSMAEPHLLCQSQYTACCSTRSAIHDATALSPIYQHRCRFVIWTHEGKEFSTGWRCQWLVRPGYGRTHHPYSDPELGLGCGEISVAAIHDPLDPGIRPKRLCISIKDLLNPISSSVEPDSSSSKSLSSQTSTNAEEQHPIICDYCRKKKQCAAWE